jgi:spore coat protein U-like protein
VKRRGGCRATLALALASAVALGAATPTLQAAASCTVTATPVAFGVYDPLLSTPRTATGRVTLRCTATGSAERVRSTIALSTGGSGSYALRSLFSGPERLNYNLFLNSAFTNIWGDGTAGSRVGTANLNVPAGQARTANRTIYGRIPALQSPAAGAFGDTIVVTVTY